MQYLWLISTISVIITMTEPQIYSFNRKYQLLHAILQVRGAYD